MLEKTIDISLSVLNPQLQDLVTTYEIYNTEQNIALNLTVVDLPEDFSGKIKIILLSGDGSTFDKEIPMTTNKFTYVMKQNVLSHKGTMAIQLQVYPDGEDSVYNSHFIFMKVVGGLLSETVPPENALASWEDMQNQMTEKLKTLDSYISVLGEFIEKYVDSK